MREVGTSLLILPSDRIILQLRDGGAPSDPNALGFFGGGLEEGETPEQAARRELGEETRGLEVARLAFRHLTTQDVPPEDPNDELLRSHLFGVRVPSADFAVCEGAGYGVFAVDKIVEHEVLAPGPRFMLKFLIEQSLLPLR